MADFTVSGSNGANDAAPGMNAYLFFAHSFIYTRNGQGGPYFYTSTYTPTAITGSETYTGAGFPRSATVELTGANLAVQTAPFAITGGTVYGFSDSFALGYPGAGVSERTSSNGFSISGEAFWSLASTSQWYSLWLLASAGDDTMTGSNVATNTDFIEGGAGNDIAYALGGDDNVWGNGGQDSLFGGDGNDVVVGNDWDTPGNTALWSSALGEAGDDRLYTGGYGHGALYGGEGSDWLWGGPDSDFLNGGPGIDYLAGGAGNDVFEIADAAMLAGEHDFIRDFQDGSDWIKLPAGTTWYVADSAYGAIISTPGTWLYLIVQYATAAMVSDQIYYV
jgi:Ca2+-binding RTX toxin-like protein